MQRLPRAGLVGALALVLSGCGSTSAPADRARVAFFGVAFKQLKGDPKLVRRLEAVLPRLLEELEVYQAIPDERVRERLRGKRGRVRACLEPPCQVRIGREVSAGMSLSVSVEQNLLQQCDVFAALFELRRSGADQRARARAGCGADELRDSVQRAVCRVLVAAAGGGAADQEAKHRECVAAAELIWLDQELERFRRHPPAGSPEEIVKEERRLAEQVLALRSRYQALTRSAPTPRASIAAECRSAGVYEAFAQSLLAAREAVEVPKTVQRQGDEAVKSFRAQMATSLEERARPLRKEATDIYRGCLRRADQLKLKTRDTEEAQRRLAALEKR